MTSDRKVIDQFMWGWQPHFRIGAQILAQSALGRIGTSLDPEIILIGFTGVAGATHPICIEPEIGTISPDSLNDIGGRAAELFTLDPDAEIWHTHPQYHEMRQALLKKRAQGNAIAEVLEVSPNLGRKTWFVSAGASVGEFWVHTALGVSEQEFGQLVALEGETVNHLPTPSSFARSVVNLVLAEIDGALHSPDPTYGDIRRSANDIVCDAADLFVKGCMYRVGGLPLGSIVNQLDDIAVRAYEKAGASGRILLVSPASEILTITTRLTQSIDFSHSRAIRKLLQATDDQIALLVYEDSAFGYGFVSNTGDDTSQVSFEIEFIDHATWQLRSGSEMLIRSSYRAASLPGKEFDELLLRDALERVFSNDADPDLISKLVHEASKSQHGATLVLSANAAEEASRLSGSSTLIDPVTIDSVMLRRFSNMDGAVVIDPKGTCHAFGVILDGAALREGDPSRGARHNSCQRYIKSITHKTLAVVVSEDGGITIIPALHKRIRRQRVTDAIRRITDAELSASAKEFADAFDNVLELEFYLNAEQCSVVNEIAKRESKRRLESSGAATQWSELSTDSDFDESYLIN